MLKLTKYITPSNPDSYMLNTPWCITIEYTRADGTNEFKAEYNKEIIEAILTDEWQEQCKENMGMNICIISIEEEPS